MGLEIKIDPASRWVEADEKLWLTADRSRLVPDGDEEAAFLFSLPGRRVSVTDAERYGLLKKTKEAAPVEEPDADSGQDETMLGEPVEALGESAPGLHVEPETKRSGRKAKKS